MSKKIIGIELALMFLILFILIKPEISGFVPKNYVKNLTYQSYSGFLFKKEVTRYPIKVSIKPLEGNKSRINFGIAGEKYELNFGYMPLNTSSMKFIEIKNENNLPSKIWIRVYGNVTDLVEVNNSNFTLGSGEERKINVLLNATKLGNYSGELDIESKTPKYKPLQLLLPYI